MLPAPFANALVLTGPTASGKTALGIELARHMNAEIISMDSMAVYRRMAIGTAKPTPEQRRQVPHHLIDVLEPWESASVAWWLEQAAQCCRDIESRGKQVFFVGGTPLYLKALMFGLFAGPAADADLRARLQEEANQAGNDTLHQRLAQVDPLAARRIHPNDLRRVIRALEVFELTGQPISTWQTEWGRASASSQSCLWLDLPRQELHERINRRVADMFAEGWLAEALALRQLGRPLSKEASQAVGYREILAQHAELCENPAVLAAVIEGVRIRTRQFAKRQITWFRHLPDCHPTTSQLTWSLWQSKMSVRKNMHVDFIE